MPQLELLKSHPHHYPRGHEYHFGILSNGVPMVTVPIANDQPGWGASVWTGAGEVVPAWCSQAPAAIQRVLTEDSYKNNATRLQAAIRRMGGLAEPLIFEQVISTESQSCENTAISEQIFWSISMSQSSITVTVKLFAAYQEHKVPELVLNFPETPVAAVLENLIAQHQNSTSGATSPGLASTSIRRANQPFERWR